MPGFLVHVGATVLCAHAGQAQATVPNPRVTVGGQPTVEPVVALAATHSGRGYWTVGADGTVSSFGDAHSLGPG